MSVRAGWGRVLAVWSLGVCAGGLPAQPPPPANLPPAPVPLVSPPPGSFIPNAPPPPGSYIPATPYGSAAPPPVEIDYDPALNGLRGWYYEMGAGAAGFTLPRIKVPNDLANTFLGRYSDFNLDWGGVGEAAVGYRFVGGASVGVRYRNLSAANRESGVAAIDPFLANVFQRAAAGTTYEAAVQQSTRFQLDQDRLDIDFTSPKHVWFEGWWDWTIGVRLDGVRLRATNRQVISAAMPGKTPLAFAFNQAVEQEMLGVGAHFALAGGWKLTDTGWGVYGRGDIGIEGVGSRQRYEIRASARLPNPDAPINYGSMDPLPDERDGVGSLTTLGCEGGLCWERPVRRGRISLKAGYGVESWFFAGGDNKEDLIFRDLTRLAHGPMFRARFDY